MADEPNSFYPPDFPVELANVIKGAHTLDAVRIAGQKKQHRIVARLHLKVGDDPTPHGREPDMSCEEIAAELWGRIESDAREKCKGFARYRIVATYSKAKTGPTPEQQSFEIECGDPPLRDRDGEVRDSITIELQALLAARHREYLELARETTKLAQSVGTMATGLATAWRDVHEKQREGREHVLELEVLKTDRESERERMRLLEKTVLPMLHRLQGKVAGKPLALAGDDADKPEIIRVARKLGRSLSSAQLDLGDRVLGSSRLRELADVEHEGELLALLHWLIGNDHVLDVYGELREDQVPMVDRLQTWAAERGEAHAAEKVAAG